MGPVRKREPRMRWMEEGRTEDEFLGRREHVE